MCRCHSTQFWEYTNLLFIFKIICVFSARKKTSAKNDCYATFGCSLLTGLSIDWSPSLIPILLFTAVAGFSVMGWTELTLKLTTNPAFMKHFAWYQHSMSLQHKHHGWSKNKGHWALQFLWRKSWILRQCCQVLVQMVADSVMIK